MNKDKVTSEKKNNMVAEEIVGDICASGMKFYKVKWRKSSKSRVSLATKEEIPPSLIRSYNKNLTKKPSFSQTNVEYDNNNDGNDDDSGLPKIIALLQTSGNKEQIKFRMLFDDGSKKWLSPEDAKKYSFAEDKPIQSTEETKKDNLNVESSKIETLKLRRSVSVINSTKIKDKKETVVHGTKRRYLQKDERSDTTLKRLRGGKSVEMSSVPIPEVKRNIRAKSCAAPLIPPLGPTVVTRASLKRISHLN